MSFSKWVLGGLGFVMGGPIGALIGVFVGSIFDSTHVSINTAGGASRTHNRVTPADIQVSIIVLIACVIKADGRVLKSEINFIKPFLVRNFGESGAKQALLLLKDLINQNIDAAAVSQQIAAHLSEIGPDIFHHFIASCFERLSFSFILARSVPFCNDRDIIRKTHGRVRRSFRKKERERCIVPIAAAGLI